MMTKKLFLGALLVSVCATAQVKFGATAKIHQSNINGIHEDSKGRIGPAVGAFAQIPIAQRTTTAFFFVPQLEVSMDGEKNKMASGEQKFNYTFINLPLFLKYYFEFGNSGLDQGKGFFAMAGPKFGLSVGDKVGGSNFTPADITVNNSYKKSNFGMAAAVGYRFMPNLEAFIRYDRGFTKVYDKYPDQTYHYQLGAGINYIFSGL